MNYLRIAAFGSGLAGLSHITLQAYSHLGMPFYLVGFVAVGIIQIALAVWLWKGKLSRELFWLTTLVNGGATIFWLLTRVMSAPFIGGVEHFTVIGVGVVVLQLLAIAAVCLAHRKILHFFLVLLGSVGLGFGAHFGAMQLEHHFPELRGTGGHHGGGHHSTMSTEEHSKMMDSHEEESEEAHDHAECDGGACPLLDSHTETSKSAENTDSLIESITENPEVNQVEVEVQAEGYHHDEPHGH